MELLEGVELLEFLNECQDQEDSFIRYMFVEIGKGIHHLHKAGIAHRDIKPENIMITKDYKLKIIDLGYGLTLAGRK
jgi:serine/threonine protein kinase